MDTKDYLSVLSGVLVFAGFMPYAVAIMRQKTIPSQATWLIWATLDGVAIWGMYVKGTVNGQIVVSVIVATGTFVFALFYGKREWKKRDYYCFAGALVCIGIGLIFPVLAIVMSMTVLFLGAIPIFGETLADPSNESLPAWVLYWLGCVAMILGIREWTFEDASQPIAFAIIETTMLILVLRGFVLARRYRNA